MPAGRVSALFGEDLDAITAGSRLEHDEFGAIAKRGGIVRLGYAAGRGDREFQVQAALLDSNQIGRGFGDLEVVAETRGGGVSRTLRQSFAQRNRLGCGGLRPRQRPHARGDAQTIRRDPDACP